MKDRFLSFLFLCFLAFLPPARGLDAQVQLHSISVRLNAGTASSMGLNYTLEISSASLADPNLNGELAPVDASSPLSYATFFRMTGDAVFDPVFGTLRLTIPDSGDQNSNRIPDFFEVSQPLTTTSTTGTFEDFEENGAVTAIWNRPAQSRTGSCSIRFDKYNLTFNHSFEIQQFNGTFSYGSTESTVTGFATFIMAQKTDRTLSGTLVLDKADPDLLKLRAGTLRNQAGQTLAYKPAENLTRAGRQYTDALVFQDGDPSTTAEDYLFWKILFEDSNDSDGDSIPDLSEGTVDRQPVLKLAVSGTNVLLTISGETGKFHEIHQAQSLIPLSWVSIGRVRLTNDPQAVNLRRVTNRPAFLRVRVQ